MVKKAQAAMEFLMTYGWAILVVLAAIAALAYFGVLSPDRFLSEKCTFPPGQACLDFTASTSQIDLRIQNSAGNDLANMNVTLVIDNGTNGPDYVECKPPVAADYQMNNGEVETWSCLGSAYVAGTFPTGKMKAAIEMNYTNQQTTMPHTKMGELIIKIA